MATLDSSFEFYKNSGRFIGGVYLALFFFMPVIRRQNILLRSLLAFTPAYLAYNHMYNIGEEYYWSGYAYLYQEIIIRSGLHDQIYA